MTTLRDYQQDLLDRVRFALDDTPDARVMLQLPTGGGKTRIAGGLLSGWLHNGRKAAWLTHRKELATQTEGMLREAGVTATANMLWTPRTNAPTLLNGVVILMAQTVSRRNKVWDGYNRNDLLIIDEAHCQGRREIRPCGGGKVSHHCDGKSFLGEGGTANEGRGKSTVVS